MEVHQYRITSSEFYCGHAKYFLKGLKFNISIYDQTNDTECYPIPNDDFIQCRNHYSHMSLPNLVGGSRLGISVRSTKGNSNRCDIVIPHGGTMLQIFTRGTLLRSSAKM